MFLLQHFLLGPLSIGCPQVCVRVPAMRWLPVIVINVACIAVCTCEPAMWFLFLACIALSLVKYARTSLGKNQHNQRCCLQELLLM